MVDHRIIPIVDQLPKEVFVVFAVVAMSQSEQLVWWLVFLLVILRRELLEAIATVLVQFATGILNIHPLTLQVDFEETAGAVRVHTAAAFAVVARHRAHCSLGIRERLFN